MKLENRNARGQGPSMTTMFLVNSAKASCPPPLLDAIFYLQMSLSSAGKDEHSSVGADRFSSRCVLQRQNVDC